MKYIIIWRTLFAKLFKKSPADTAVLALLALMQASIIILQMLAIENFLNDATVTGIFFWHNFLLLFAAIITNKLLNGFFNYNLNMFIKKASKTTELIYIERMLQVPIDSFYDVNFEIRKSRAEKGAKSASLFLMVSLMILFFNIPFLVMFSVYVTHRYPLLLIGALAPILTGVFSAIKNQREFIYLEKEIAAGRREAQYYLSCIADKEFYKETLIFGGFKYFRQKYDATISLLSKRCAKAERKALTNEIIAQSFKMLSYLLMFIMLLYSLKNNHISIGAFGAIITSLTSLYSVIEDTLQRDIGNLSHFYADVENYIKFIDSKSQSQKQEIDMPRELELLNLSYKYPNEQMLALNNLSLSIKKGSILAIVGENGSGKTTFSKILMGLLNPGEGRIFADGCQVDFSKCKIRGVSAVFQDFFRYAFSLRENVCISGENQKEADINRVLEQCGVSYQETKIFPQGLDTILSREFGGTDISGGQWQRIAIARGQFRNSQMLVLDEPTSAIDPLEESALYDRFAKMCEGKTGIIITHRLGLTRIADSIAVFENGKVVETGSHASLMKAMGKYYDMYTKQAAMYGVQLVP